MNNKPDKLFNYLKELGINQITIFGNRKLHIEFVLSGLKKETKDSKINKNGDIFYHTDNDGMKWQETYVGKSDTFTKDGVSITFEI